MTNSYLSKLACLSVLLLGCVAPEDVSEEDLVDDGVAERGGVAGELVDQVDEPVGIPEAAAAAGICWKGALQVRRSGEWQNVGLDGGKPRVTSAMAKRTWTVNNSRFMGTGGNWADCGEAYDSSAPRACTMVAATATRRTSFHSCNGGSIHDCVYNSAGTMLTVDNATDYCVDYDSNGYLRSYARSSCSAFRIVDKTGC